MPITIQPSDFYTCRDCGETKAAELFSINNASHRGRSNFCKLCTQIKNKNYIKNNPERRKQSSKDYYAKLKQTVFDVYGNFCVCCGETEKAFLTIDHIKGDGAEHRKILGNRTLLYKSIRDEGFPKNKYQVLCHNCNWSKGAGVDGKCIHQRKVEQMFYDAQQAQQNLKG